MAIKDRLLKSLKSAYDIMNEATDSHPQKMHPVLLALVKAQDLCRKGLPDKSYAKYGEVYDGIIMAINQILSGEAGKDVEEIVTLCKELLEHIVTETCKEEHFKKEIVFLPYKASMWDSMESVWQAAIDDQEHTIPYVVAIPYCDKDAEGRVREWHCEGTELPQYVPVMDYRNVDLATMHPDVIVIQNPYDDYNTVTSVDTKYYSRYLKEYTDKLVYIPYFVLEEPDLDDEEALEDIADFLFHGEAVRNANLTIVQSENMREAYIRLLVKYSNKDRAFWQKRILGLGSPKIDKVLSTRREDVPLPESWRRIIERSDGTRKKVILYNVSLTSLLEYEEKLFDKMDWAFQIFSEQQGKAVLLWRPHPLFEATIKSQVPELWNRYRKMVEQYRDEGWGIYDDSPDLHRAIAVSDGYYGELSSLVKLFQSIKKPILLQHIASTKRDDYESGRDLHNKSVHDMNFWGEYFVFSKGTFLDRRFYFTNQYNTSNGLYYWDAVTQDVHVVEFGEDGECYARYSDVLLSDGLVYMAPLHGNALTTINLSTEEVNKYPVSDPENASSIPKYSRMYQIGQNIWFVPIGGIKAISRFDTKTCTFKHDFEFYKKLVRLYPDLNHIESREYPNHIFIDSICVGKKIWMLFTKMGNKVVGYNTENNDVQLYECGEETDVLRSVDYDGECFWIGTENGDLLQWNMRTGIRKRLNNIFGEQKCICVVKCIKGDVWLFPYLSSKCGKVDVSTYSVNVFSFFHDDSEMLGAVPRIAWDRGRNIYCFPGEEGNRIARIDIEENKIEIYKIGYHEQTQLQYIQRYITKKRLFYEESPCSLKIFLTAIKEYSCEEKNNIYEKNNLGHSIYMQL